MTILEDSVMIPFTCEVLKAVFCNVNCSELIMQMQKGIHSKENICDLTRSDSTNPVKYLRNLLEDSIYNSSNCYFRQELENYIEYFLNGFSVQKPNIYDVLSAFAQKMIIRSENQFCFRYEYTDVWRNFSRYVDEEIILVSAIYNDNRRRHKNSYYLDFPYCIHCDNAEIKNMLKRIPGTSENHFHLRGSSPYFYIAWINLMNNVYQPDFDIKMEDISHNSLMNYGKGFTEEPLSLLCKKAAAIRFYLYNLMEQNFQKKEEKEEKKNRFDVFDYLYQKNLVAFDTGKLQNKINYYFSCSLYNISDHKDIYIDYAQLHKNVRENFYTKYFNLQGERNFFVKF